jgi:glycosyltransferase involved in cell wall biosynthesis/polysaccharide pyruvyl transferase WcaK-like protein/spore maturation protein CgeB
VAPKKIAIFYGHVASNIGDIAINQGEVRLLREAFPEAMIQVVLLDAEKSEFLQSAKSSFGNDGTIAFRYFNANYERALIFHAHPERFFKECGTEDADLIVLASGEHLFAYANPENKKSLFWRTLPALAAKANNKPCVLLPSTFGPFEDEQSFELISSFLSLVDDFATRETYSARTLNAHFSFDALTVGLDPAFFIEPPASSRISNSTDYPDKKIIGLIMRSEGWGIRLSKEQRTKLTDSFKENSYKNSISFQFSFALVNDLLQNDSTVVQIFIQTTADEELAQHIINALSEQGSGEKVQLIRPRSVEDYLSQLSMVDYVVASRFHAIILSLIVNTPVFGVYFDAHGHKMPGLFELLGLGSKCICLSTTAPEHAAESVVRSINSKDDTWLSVHQRIAELKNNTVSWLAGYRTRQPESKILLNGFGTFGDIAFSLACDGFEAVKKKDIQVVQKSKTAVDTKLAETQSQLKEARGKATLLAAEIENLKSAHVKNVAKLKEDREQALAALAAEHVLDTEALKSAHAENVAKFKEDSEQALAALTAEHVHDTEALKSAHAENVAKLKEDREQTLAALAAAHMHEVEAINSAHAGNIARLTEEYNQALTGVESKAGALETELANLRSESAELREKLEQTNIRNLDLNEQTVLLREWDVQNQAELARTLEEVRLEQTKRIVVEKELFRLGEQLKNRQAVTDESVGAGEQKITSLKKALEKNRVEGEAITGRLKKENATLTRELAQLQRQLDDARSAQSGFPATREIGDLQQLLAVEQAGHQAMKDAFIRSSSELEIIQALHRAEQMINEGAHKGTITAIAPASAVGQPATPTFVESIKRLKVACIMDEFTYSSYRPECNLLRLTPQHWQHELESFAPDLLFVESAWKGKDALWARKIAANDKELAGIVEWCRSRQVPTVFWNKEDPVHFALFLNTAKLFDYVFTTDIDCIKSYKGALGHDRVYLLPFACQPQSTNPLEIYDRKDAFCFAGSYYDKYPERTRDLDNFVTSLAGYKPIEIYDRNFGKEIESFRFPPQYQPFIVGSLPFDQIDKAYKGYRYAINLNSIKQSQSMFARRVFELLASNTVTISNFSRGLRLFFGDLVISTDNGDEILNRLRAPAGIDLDERKLRLAGLRKVMQEHTYQDRLAYVVSKVRGETHPLQLLPRAVVTAYAGNPGQFAALLESFNRQLYADRQLIIVVPDDFTPERVTDGQSIRVLSASDAGLEIGDLLDSGEYVAAMVPDDYYGPNYLADLVLATRYSNASVIGKVSHYAFAPGNGLNLTDDGKQYRLAAGVPARSCLVKGALIGELPLRDWLAGLDSQRVEAAEVLAVDEFNYCKNGNTPEFLSEHVDIVNDLVDIDTGIGINELIAQAESIAPATEGTDAFIRDDCTILNPEEFGRLFPYSTAKITFRQSYDALQVTSTLGQGEHDYVYGNKYFSLEELGLKEQIKFHLRTSLGFNVQIVVIFFNSMKERISHVIRAANSNQFAVIPEEAVWIKLGLRFFESGSTEINEFLFGHLHMISIEVAKPVQADQSIKTLSESERDLLDVYRKYGADQVIQEIAGRTGENPGKIARELLKFGKLLGAEGHQDAEYSVSLAATGYERSEPVLRGFFWAAQRAKEFEAACDIILELEQIAGPNPSAKQSETLQKLKTSPAYQLSVLKLIETKQSSVPDSIPQRICYVLHNSLPYSSGGYGTRSHGVAAGLMQAGYEVIVLTRPGFPVDIKPELSANDVPLIEDIDGISYVRTFEPLRAGMSALAYMTKAADAIEERIRENRPEFVISASNHITALPALIAARRLGLPFIYEVRGLWEITRMSRDSEFADKPAFAVQKILEASVAKNADYVFTLTEPMREELIERGVQPEKIDLLPNSCDPSRFLPRDRDEELAERLGIPCGVPVIGYIGTFVDYEGLEDLTAACALLKAQEVQFRLLMVGNENASGQDRGPITEEIARIAEEYDFTDWLIMPGRVPHEEVESYYSLIDVAPFPRKPWPVCEMVSPMKPLEALAMEKAVIVSSVRALVEMIEHEKTGLVFDKGNVESLADTLQRLIKSPELRRQLGIQGRKWVEQERTWRQVGVKAFKIIENLKDKKTSP